MDLPSSPDVAAETTPDQSLQPLPVESPLTISVEYLNWWLREGRIPATLTTSSQASQGLLGQPDTRILYGDQRLRTRHDDQFGGVGAKVAYWFDDGQTTGVEADGFTLERDSTHFRLDSNGSTLLARPYFNADGSPASAIVAGQTPEGLRSGSFVGYSRIELFGEEANLIGLLLRGGDFRLDLLGGARFLQMRDRTDLTGVSVSLPVASTLYSQEDHYRTGNAYYGGQIGLRGECIFDRWTVDLRGAIGLGANEEQLREFGYSLYQTPVARIVSPNGLTVQANDTGTFNRTAVNLLSTVGVKVNYRLTPHASVCAGYSFLLWDGALRSGDQINPVVNTNPHAAPGIAFKQDTFWAQGVDVGLMLAW